MKENITIFLPLLLSQFAFSQVPKADSIHSKAQSKLDSLANSPWQKRLDSLHSLGNLEKYKDSLKVLGWADSLKQKVNTTFSSKQNELQSKVDSLLVRNQPTALVQRRIDSLQNKQQALLGEISAKQNQLQQKVNAQYKKWGSRLDSLGLKAPTFANPNIPSIDKSNSQLNSLTTKLPTAPNIKLPNASLPNSAIPATSLPNVSLPNTFVPNATLPNISLPNTSLPSTSIPNTAIPNTSIPNTSLPSLNTSDFANLNLSKDLNNVGGKFAVPGTDQMKQWNDQLKNVSQPIKEVTGKLNEAKGALKDPSKAAEGAVKQLGDVNTISKEMGNADKLMKENEAMKTAEAMKDPEKMKEEVAKKAIDHFAGKEEVLKQAMNQMAKIKKKVPSLESLDKLPKNLWIPRNGLKGKPFRERVRFGINAGLKARRDTIGVDLFPNVSYNLTGRVELGGGFNYRVVWLDRSSSFQQKNPAWGFNMFGTFKTFKSVLMRLEADAFSTAHLGGVGEPVKRDWQWAWYLGAQTSYNISKNCKGNVQMLYNFQKRITDSFPEQLVIRVEVQWKLGEKRNENSKSF